MELKELALKVQEVRKAQTDYFKYRSNENLNKSKALEKALDQIVQDIMNRLSKNQQSLF